METLLHDVNAAIAAAHSLPNWRYIPIRAGYDKETNTIVVTSDIVQHEWCLHILAVVAANLTHCEITIHEEYRQEYMTVTYTA